MFPQTPARVQLSLWPAGLASNGIGTVDWAGGLVDWNSQDIQNNGYYYATFESVTVNCYNATSPPGTNTGVSYTYSGYAGTNDTVVDGKEPTVLSSFLGTGTDMSAGAPSGTASGAVPSSSAETVPGISGNNGVDSHGAGSSSSVSSASTATTASSGSSSTSTSSSGSGGFSQGSGSSSGSTTKSGADKLGASQEKVLGGSVFAGIVAVVAMMAL
jgi:hypothetical protein